MEKPDSHIKVGCCGFSAGQQQYRTLFSTVEVQQTFYQPPRLATLKRWREEFPHEFEFTLKAWQLITHEAWSKTYRRLKVTLTAEQRAECGYFRDTPIVREAWQTTIECAQALNAELVLFQCPAGFKPTPENLERMRHFFNTIERAGLRLLWEPRGEDWEPALVKSLCHELNLIHAVDPFVNETVTPELVYYRLHGGEGYRHVYEDEELQTLLNRLPPSAPAYVMFNNINMLTDAQRFQSLLEKEGN